MHCPTFGKCESCEILYPLIDLTLQDNNTLICSECRFKRSNLEGEK